jgi:hypothetical protein
MYAPNQFAANRAPQIRKRWNAIREAAATERANRIDTALMVAGSLLAVAAVIAAIMGA